MSKSNIIQLLHMNLIRFSIALLFTLCHITSIGQNVTGRIINSSYENIDGASIVMQLPDSTHVASTIVDDNGYFIIETKPQLYRLIIQCLGYKTLTLQSDKSDLGEIMLDSTDYSLGEVVVKAERPFVKANTFGLEYNLETMMKNQIANNSWEAIAKLPGIIESGDKLSLAGASNLTIILNGKPTTMSAQQLETLLRNTPISRVEKVEIMYSAPPQYHTRGAVINIILKRNYDYTFQGIINTNYYNQFYSKGALDGNLRFSTPKWAIDVTYGLTAGKAQQHTETHSFHTLDNNLHEIHQQAKMSGKGTNHNIRSAIEYNINDSSHISVAYTGNILPDNKTNSYSYGSFQESLNKKLTDSQMHNIMLQCHLGFGLDIGGDFTYYKNNNTQDLSINYLDGNNDIINTIGGQRINRYTVYADRTRNLPLGWSIGYGVSYTHAHDKDFQTYIKNEGNRPTQNTHSDLTEQTTNFYVSASKQYATGPSFSIAATGEYYTIGNYHKWSIYPQANLTYFKNPNHIYQLSLSTDKTYPEYWSMQSSISYIDGYSEVHGSPGLKPITSYNANLAYILKQKYIFSLFYTYDDNTYYQVAYQASDRLALIYKSMNWNYSQNLGINIIVPFSIDSWLNSRFMFVGMYMHQRCDNFYDIPFNRKKLLAITSLNNTFNIGKNISLELNGRFQSPAIQGTWDIKSIFNCYAGVKWRFANDNASLSLSCDDIFNSGFPKTSVNFKGQRLEQNSSLHHRSISAKFSYKFGGYKTRKNKTVDTSRFGH